MKLTRKQLRKLILEQVQGINIKRVFYSSQPYTSFRNIQQISSDSVADKPRGLWYSCGDGWKEWVQFEMPSLFNNYNHLYEITLNPERILFISDNANFNMFQDKDGIQGRWEIMIDWPAVSRDYAGIEICPYFPKKRDISWYYPWDVASGCVWSKDGVLDIVEIPFDTKLPSI